MKDNLFSNVSERTQLAGANKFEILCFSAVEHEVYGINVFKVREVIKMVKIDQVPGAPKGVVGMASIRGDVMPIIDLNIIFDGQKTVDPTLLIITEFSGSTQAILAKSVDTIYRVAWEQVLPVKDVVGDTSIPLTSIIKLENDKLISILDVEQIICGIRGGIEAGTMSEKLDGRVVYVEDSFVARKHLSGVFDSIGVSYKTATNGEEGYNLLEAMVADGSQLSAHIDLVVTDVEMPKMDGYVLTQKIKAHPQMKNVPVVMYSSLTNETNERRGKEVGADGYINKFDADEVFTVLKKWLVR